MYIGIVDSLPEVPEPVSIIVLPSIHKHVPVIKYHSAVGSSCHRHLPTTPHT